MRAKDSGGRAPGTCSANQASTRGTSIPSSGRPVASPLMAANPMPGTSDHAGLLVDFGGVLTTSVWDSFADFCRRKGLSEDSIRRLFREDPAALNDLRELETGRMEEQEFER